MKKAESEIEKLQKQLDNTTGRAAKQKLRKKMERARQNAEKKRKGTEDTNSGKRN